MLLALTALLAACSSRPPAPVVQRSDRPPPAEIPVDGLYRVRQGDTLYGIAFKYGLDYRDVGGWNRIAAPFTIYPDQVLRLSPPPSGQSRVATTGVRRPSSSTTTSSTPPPAANSPTPATTRPATTTVSKPAPSQPAPAATPPATAPTPAPKPATTASASASGWAWPVDGRLLRTFKDGDPSRNGLDIAGKEGQNVLAASGGEVVYSGNGLIGYGELVIVKHDDRLLSAYAHNRRRLVAEGDVVARGQKIAEMGRNDRNENVLHFEIRRDGKPVDPMNYLPRK